MKRALIAATIAVLALSACGDDESGDGDSTAKDTTTTQGTGGNDIPGQDSPTIAAPSDIELPSDISLPSGMEMPDISIDPGAAMGEMETVTKKVGESEEMDLITGGKLKVAVLKVQDVKATDSNKMFQPDAGQKWVGVQFEMDNPGPDAWTLTPQISFRALDADGKEITPELMGSIAEGKMYETGLNLAAGKKQADWIVFEVPSDATLTKLVYRPGASLKTVEWAVD